LRPRCVPGLAGFEPSN